MVEVFKTNIEYEGLANQLVEQIHKTFPGYRANFDLDDCDNVLRVAFAGGWIDACLLINFLKSFGCYAQVLPDEDTTASSGQHLLKHYLLIN